MCNPAMIEDRTVAASRGNACKLVFVNKFGGMVARKNRTAASLLRVGKAPQRDADPRDGRRSETAMIYFCFTSIDGRKNYFLKRWRIESRSWGDSVSQRRRSFSSVRRSSCGSC